MNYAYGVLEGECRRAIKVVGLEPSVGFLHEVSNYQTKESLAYDLQEPFRWLVDVSVLQAFESGVLELHDFYFTGDDYRYRFEPEARQRFIEVLREKFNSGAVYKGRNMKWDTIIQEKTSELGRYVSSRSRTLDLSDPPPVLERTNDRAIRKRIYCLTQSEASRRGIGKSTLHYLRKNSNAKAPFRIYTKVRARLNEDLLQMERCRSRTRQSY